MTTGNRTGAGPSGLSDEARGGLRRELEVLRGQREALDTAGDELGIGDRADAAEALRRRDDAALLDERIAEINRILHGGQLPVGSPGSGLRDGSAVTLRHGDGTVETLRAVAITAAVPEGEEDSSLTLDSPLGRALAGHQAGDTVTYETPEGRRRAEILELRLPGQ